MKPKTIKSFIESFFLAIFPILLTSILLYYFGEKHSIRITIISYIVSSILLFIISTLFNRLPWFRQYKKYEGKWIEIIHDFPREISICELSFKKGEYHFKGNNYWKDGVDWVSFESIKFIENGYDSFFYITTCSDDSLPEGYGKIKSISNLNDGYFQAKGYFFDVSSEGNQKIHETTMIKFEKAFWKNRITVSPGENPKRFTSKQVYDHVKDYIEQNYLRKGHVHDKQQST